MDGYDLGMVGVGVMGSNLLLNMADHGFKVIGYDKNPEKTKALEAAAGAGAVVKGVNTLAEMVSALQKPRKIMMLVPAGAPVDSVIGELLPLVEEGDIIIDGGNSHYTDTLQRVTALKGEGIHFMGMGISGGEAGARLGPSIMPGGDKAAFGVLEPILKSIAARVDGEPCVDYMGTDAAGHYVKMVHNGIEYAIMQLISECYDIMRNGVGLDNQELGKLFNEWNQGEMRSFLIGITADIFMKKEGSTNNYLVDMILDKAGAKGTGKWTSQAALDLGEPIPVIDMAVMMRNVSALKEERTRAHELYRTAPGNLLREVVMPVIHDALLFATVISYAQGLALLSKASLELKMEISLPAVVRVWRGGCIIRSALLDNFLQAYQKDAMLPNLLLDAGIARSLFPKRESLVTLSAMAISNGYPASALCAALNYFNAYGREKLPTNLVQAQRDFFGSHTYERIDRQGVFHTEWDEG